MVINRSRAEDVVVLHGVARRRLGVINRVGQGCSLKRLLLRSLNFFWSLDTYEIQRGGKNVNDMAVLGADFPFVLNPLGPENDQRIVSAALAVRIFLPVLERSIRGLSPAKRIIPLRRFRRANLS